MLSDRSGYFEGLVVATLSQSVVMQRYRYDTIRDKLTLCRIDDLAEELTERSRQADLIAVF